MKDEDFWFEKKFITDSIAGSVCNDDWSGTRHAYRCTVKHFEENDEWKRKVPLRKTARKVYINKPYSSKGKEQLQILQNGDVIVDQLITPGTEGNFLPGEKKAIEVRIKTTGIGINEESNFYIHVEWYS